MPPEDFRILIETVTQTIIPRFSEEDRQEMAKLYRADSSLRSISEKFLWVHDNPAAIETAVRIIVMEMLGDEYRELAEWKWWRLQFLWEIGIHSKEFNKGAAGAKWALAIWRATWEEDEKDFIVFLANQSKYRRWGWVSATNILLAFSEEFRDRPARSAKAISRIIESLKKEGRINENGSAWIVEK